MDGVPRYEQTERERRAGGKETRTVRHVMGVNGGLDVECVCARKSMSVCMDVHVSAA